MPAGEGPVDGSWPSTPANVSLGWLKSFRDPITRRRTRNDLVQAIVGHAILQGNLEELAPPNDEALEKVHRDLPHSEHDSFLSDAKNVYCIAAKHDWCLVQNEITHGKEAFTVASLYMPHPNKANPTDPRALAIGRLFAIEYEIEQSSEEAARSYDASAPNVVATAFSRIVKKATSRPLWHATKPPVELDPDNHEYWLPELRDIPFRSFPGSILPVTPQTISMMRLDGRLDKQLTLREPLWVVVQEDDDSVMVSDPEFRLYGYGREVKQAVRDFRFNLASLYGGYVRDKGSGFTRGAKQFARNLDKKIAVEKDR